MAALTMQLEAAEREGKTPDQIGQVLFYRLLDTMAAVERADESYRRAHTPEQREHAAIAAEVARVRQTLASAQIEAHVASVRASELDERGHHPSFTERERRWFYAQLGGVCKRRGYDKKLAESLSEVAFKRLRPSAMPARHVRLDYLAWLESPEGVDAYEHFHEAHVQRLAEEEEARGPSVKCENCGRLSNALKCRCGWKHQAVKAAA